MRKTVKVRRMFLRSLLLVFVTVYMHACVTDDDVDFPDENTSEATPSIAIVTFLHYLEVTANSDDDPCFEFVYPIDLQLSNGVRLQVEDFTGLKEIVQNQTNDLHVDGIVYPLLVTKGTELRSIEDETGMTVLLEDCGIPTFKDSFFKYLWQCFELQFPLAIRGKEGDADSVNNFDDFLQFKEDQGDDYQPDFIYPLKIEVFDVGLVTIESEYALYQLFDECPQCPALFFIIDKEFVPGRYKFHADFSGIKDLHSYDWYINGNFVERDGTGVQGDNLLEETFHPGTYEICIKAETDECPDGVVYCELLVVEEECPDLHFEVFEDSSALELVADFDLMNNISYTWAVYQGEELVFFEAEDPGQGDNKLLFDFDPGKYTVCVESEIKACTEVLRFCKDIEIEDPCPELFFDFIREEGSNVYRFDAEFMLMNDIQYTWVIFSGDEIVYSEIEEPGKADHVMAFEFTTGTYDVCIKAETESCTEGTEFCEKLVVN